MSQLTPAQAFEHASALLPIVAITSSPDGYSYGWTKVPRLSHSRKLWTAEGKGDCHYIGHDNIDWQTADIEKRIYVPTQTRRYRPFASAAEFMPHSDKWIVCRGGDEFYRLNVANDVMVWTHSGSRGIQYKHLFIDYTFADGSPCGVEVLE
jgi:hypothetical protein